MSASEVAPNPFWYAKPTAALTSRDRLSICVLAMFVPKSVNQLYITRVGRPVKPPAWFWPAAVLCQLAPKFWTPIPQLMGVKIARRNTLIAKNQPCSASIAHSQGARARVVSGPSGWPLAFGLRGEHRAHPEECNRADWRSTLRYAAAAKRRWKREIVRLPTLRSGSAQRLVQHGSLSSP